MIRKHILMIALSLLCATAFAEDWLGGGYVGSPNHAEIRQYFTDPIFYSSLPVSKPIGLYSSYSTMPSLKPTLGLGKYSSKDYFQSPSKSRYSFSTWPSSYGSRYTTPYQSPTTIPKLSPILGNTPVTIKYPDNSRKFDVYVDGVYVGSGLGGTFTTNIQGGEIHDIRIWNGSWNYQKRLYFQPGIQKVIYVVAA